MIVLDLMLPGMTGYEVLETLKEDEQTSDIPVLVLTAKSLRADRERSHGLGASSFLTKPFLPSELCELVDSLVLEGAEPEAVRRRRPGPRRAPRPRPPTPTTTSRGVAGIGLTGTPPR